MRGEVATLDPKMPPRHRRVRSGASTASMLDNASLKSESDLMIAFCVSREPLQKTSDELFA